MNQLKWIATAVLVGMLATAAPAAADEPPIPPTPETLNQTGPPASQLPPLPPSPGSLNQTGPPTPQPTVPPAPQLPPIPTPNPNSVQPETIKPAVEQPAANPATVESRVKQLESELADLRNQMQSAASQNVFADGCDSWSEACGWIVGYDATILKFHDSAGVRGIATPMEFEYAWAPRVWVGYTGPTGVGMRARYWDFDERHVVGLANGGTDSLRVDTWLIDMEITNWIELGRYWTAVISGGWRYIEYKETRRQTFANGAISGFQEFQTPNLGGTLAGEFYAHISPTSSLFAIGRTSAVFGDDATRNAGNVGFAAPSQDAVRWMWESQLGIETKLPGEFCDVFFRLAGEVQYWDGFGGFSPTKSAVGFSGFTGSLGFVY